MLICYETEKLRGFFSLCHVQQSVYLTHSMTNGRLVSKCGEGDSCLDLEHVDSLIPVNIKRLSRNLRKWFRFEIDIYGLSV